MGCFASKSKQPESEGEIVMNYATPDVIVPEEPVLRHVSQSPQIMTDIPKHPIYPQDSQSNEHFDLDDSHLARQGSRLGHNGHRRRRHHHHHHHQHSDKSESIPSQRRSVDLNIPPSEPRSPRYAPVVVQRLQPEVQHRRCSLQSDRQYEPRLLETSRTGSSKRRNSLPGSYDRSSYLDDRGGRRRRSIDAGSYGHSRRHRSRHAGYNHSEDWREIAKDDLKEAFGEAAGLVGKAVMDVTKQVLRNDDARDAMKQIVKEKTRRKTAGALTEGR